MADSAPEPAVSLAENPAAEAAPVAPARACVFECGGQAYAFPVAEVREVAMLSQVTPVPRLPAQVRGIANLRGVMLPVVDPGPALGHGPAGTRPVTPTVVLRDGREDVGLVVDQVHGLLPMEESGPLERAGTGSRAAFAQGAFRAAGRWVILLDGRTLLEALRPPRLSQPELV
jgi:purine-binding chemotaxis protein CheW